MESFLYIDTTKGKTLNYYTKFNVPYRRNATGGLSEMGMIHLLSQSVRLNLLVLVI
jgi:hypothetical protein